MLNSLLQRLDANYLKSLASEPEQQEYFKLRPVYTSLSNNDNLDQAPK